MSVAVVIPATRRSVDGLINGLQAGSRVPDKIIVVSNEIHPEEPCELIGFSSKLHPIGIGDAGLRRNIGADVATSDVLLFLDDDLLATRDLVRVAVEVVERDGFCWGHHRYIDFNQYPAEALLDAAPEIGRSRERYVNNWHGWQSSYAGLFAIRRDLFWKAGGFDLGYLGYHGNEDQQLGRRLSKENNRKTFVHEPPFAWHPTIPMFHQASMTNACGGSHRLRETWINGFSFATCESCPFREPLDVEGMTLNEEVVIPYQRSDFELWDDA